MKIFTLLLLLSSLLLSQVYYSKVEPYELRNISSNVNGVVLFTDEDKIGQKLSNASYLRIDAKLDRDELKYTKVKIKNLKDSLAANATILKNLKESLDKKRSNYEKVKKLKIKSSVEKDREFYELISSENSYLNTQKERYSQKTQIADLELRVKQLNESIKDKNLRAKGFVLYSIDVKVGQVVSMATPLARVADISKALLTIYLNEEDVIGAKRSAVYLDGKKSSYKISRILKIADSKNISKYKAQIVIKSPKVFSKLMKIELRKD